MQGRKRKGTEIAETAKRARQIVELPWVDECTESKQDKSRWTRKPLEAWDASRDSIGMKTLASLTLVFQQMDALYHVEKGEHSFAAKIRNKEPSYPVIKMYGITAEGHSVMIHIHGGNPFPLRR
jgi:hypothetical protein